MSKDTRENITKCNHNKELAIFIVTSTLFKIVTTKIESYLVSKLTYSNQNKVVLELIGVNRRYKFAKNSQNIIT